MPKQVQFLVRNAESGKMATVVAGSLRAAMTHYAAENGPEVGTEFWVKERGSDLPWTCFRISGNGIRDMGTVS